MYATYELLAHKDLLKVQLAIHSVSLTDLSRLLKKSFYMQYNDAQTVIQCNTYHSNN